MTDTTPTGTTVAAANTAVPATFNAAPSAYASTEPKSETEGFFSKFLTLGSGEAPQAAPAIAVAAEAATPVPALAPVIEKKPAPKHVLARTAHAKPTPVAPKPAQTAQSGQPAAAPLVKVAAAPVPPDAAAATPR